MQKKETKIMNVPKALQTLIKGIEKGSEESEDLKTQLNETCEQEIKS